jgi:hypothetical protein
LYAGLAPLRSSAPTPSGSRAVEVAALLEQDAEVVRRAGATRIRRRRCIAALLGEIPRRFANNGEAAQSFFSIGVLVDYRVP